MKKIVFLDIVNTLSTSEVFIPTDTFASGNYTIKITYGTNILSGTFMIKQSKKIFKKKPLIHEAEFLPSRYKCFLLEYKTLP